MYRRPNNQQVTPIWAILLIIVSIIGIGFAVIQSNNNQVPVQSQNILFTSTPEPTTTLPATQTPTVRPTLTPTVPATATQVPIPTVSPTPTVKVIDGMDRQATIDAAYNEYLNEQGDKDATADAAYQAYLDEQASQDATLNATSANLGNAFGNASCVIKGNISANGEKIYHLPNQRFYDETGVNTSKGERWFCSEEDAIAAGWRKSKV